MNELLDRLCRRCGVVAQYHDIWGQAHAPSDAARRALLAAMGLAADDDAAIIRSLDELDRRDWQRPLPPVLVLPASARPYRVPITLAEPMSPLTWRLVRESGEASSGEFDPADLEAEECHELDGLAYTRRRLLLDLDLEPGYHRLTLEHAGGEIAAMSLILAPATCHAPPALRDGGRLWGYAAQLYGIRSQRNWGIGDFGDLRRMLDFCAEAGAGTVLLNPLHALFPEAPEHASPYSPSHRAWFNTLYLDVTAIPEFAECGEARALVEAPAFQARLRALRESARVDYRGVAAAKAQVLVLLHGHFRSQHQATGGARAQAFRDFRQAHGDGLEQLALFEALQAHFHDTSGAWGWPAWPEEYRDPDSPAVAAFRAAHGDRVDYFAWLQWQAEQQLAAANAHARELGLGVGVMLDLAIGVAEGGGATWAQRGLYALGASTGAPPDDFNRQGQDWGLPPLIPWRLREAAYQPFIELLRANMGDAGALRMDHVMGLFRLFWVARGLPAADGTYVEYPFADLLGILALESRRNRCLVLGEDLGTVPDAVREALGPLGVLSTRLLYFERNQDGSPRPPRDYPAAAAAAVTSHDLPTLAGYWRGLDIAVRDGLHLFPNAAARDQQVAARTWERTQLLLALQREGLLPTGIDPHAPPPELDGELAAAVYAYLARSPSQLVLVQMEDAFGVAEQPNLPGTTEPDYPCWRLKLPPDLEAWPDHAWLAGINRSLDRERPAAADRRLG